MPLESLENGQINIHDLTLEQEKKPMTESEKLYEDLKKTPLYDPEHDQWVEFINEDQNPMDPKKCYSSDQLINILIETHFNKPLASNHYNSLKQSPFYDQEGGRWNQCINIDQSLESDVVGLRSELFSIIAEASFNKQSAQQHFEELKDSPLFNKAKNEWYGMLNFQKTEPAVTGQTTFNQLLGILAEFEFDPEKAKSQYKDLKKTSLYDKKINQWEHVSRKYSSEFNLQGNLLRPSRRFSNTQFLAILIEARFDKASAKEQYQALKHTALYDTERKQWNQEIIGDNHLQGNTRESENQLLGILCEHEFEEPAINLDTQTPQLPETRKY